MEKNVVATNIRIIGQCILIIGIIAAFIVGHVFPSTVYTIHGLDETYNWPLTIGTAISSIVSSAFFYGISEIIRLLDKLVSLSETKNTSEDDHDKLLESIESALPKM